MEKNVKLTKVCLACVERGGGAKLVIIYYSFWSMHRHVNQHMIRYINISGMLRSYNPYDPCP